MSNPCTSGDALETGASGQRASPPQSPLVRGPLVVGWIITFFSSPPAAFRPRFRLRAINFHLIVSPRRSWAALSSCASAFVTVTRIPPLLPRTRNQYDRIPRFAARLPGKLSAIELFLCELARIALGTVAYKVVLVNLVTFFFGLY